MDNMPIDFNKNDYAITCLHRYFYWSDRMRLLHIEFISKFDKSKMEKAFSNENLMLSFVFSDFLMYLSYCYAGIYVVIEGWRELKLYDSEIEELLKSPYVEELKRYRNGMYHFQRDLFDDRFFKFLNGDTASAEWIIKLNKAFDRWFIDWYSKKFGIDIRETTKSYYSNEEGIWTAIKKMHDNVLDIFDGKES